MHSRLDLRRIQAWVFVLALGAARVHAAQTVGDHPCRADYHIQVSADPIERVLQGDETIVWRNETQHDDVFDLQFHLYWNAFSNNRSTLMRESGGFTRGGEVSGDEWGWQRITSIEIGGLELVSKLRYLTPDDVDVDDRTVFRIPLPATAKPGETVTARVKWEARIPRVRTRTGCKDDFLFIAQWFPKLGVYDAGNGWNCHQFHASTEFFSDYGTYDVTIDLPARYEGKIGASGVAAEPEKVIGDRVVARFVAPSTADQQRADQLGRFPLVHDFTWTADPRYVVHSEFTFHFDEWAARYKKEVEGVALALGRGVDELGTRDVDVTLLLHPEHDDQAQRHFEATCASLFFYGLWFGGYPYEHITVVDPAWGAGGAGGMEYPTLFTAGSRMFTWPGMQSPESVTVHECGHQFWYGLVGNNEFEAAWLDEGFNTFSQNETLPLAFGPSHRASEYSGLYFDGVPLAKDPGGGDLADVLAMRTMSLPKGLTLHAVRSSPFVDWWRSQPALSFARMRDDARWGARNGYLSDPDSDPIDTSGWKYVDFQSYRQNSYRRPSVMLATLQGLVGRERFLRGMRLYSERWRYGHPYPQDFFDAFVTGANVDVQWYFQEAFESTATVDWSVEVSQKRADPPSGWFQDADGAFKKREAPSTAQSESGGAEDQGEHGALVKERLTNDARSGESSGETSRDGADHREADRPASEANRTKAETASTGADPVRPDATTARIGADQVRPNATTGRAGVETVRPDATTAQAGTETVRPNAEPVRVDAEPVRAVAEGVRSNSNAFSDGVRSDANASVTPRADAKATDSGDEGRPWAIDVVVRRKGSFLLPVKLQLTYEDGSTETFLWSREEQARKTWWKPLAGREPSKQKIISAVIDPERLYLLDTDMSNNQWFEAVDSKSAWRWGERVLTQYAHLLHWYGGLGG